MFEKRFFFGKKLLAEKKYAFGKKIKKTVVFFFNLFETNKFILKKNLKNLEKKFFFWKIFILLLAPKSPCV